MTHIPDGPRIQLPVVTETSVTFRVDRLRPNVNHSWRIIDPLVPAEIIDEGRENRVKEGSFTTRNVRPQLLPLDSGTYLFQVFETRSAETRSAEELAPEPTVELPFQYLAPVVGSVPVPAQSVRLERAATEPTADTVLYQFIRDMTRARRFDAYLAFVAERVRPRGRVAAGSDAYRELVRATEQFLASAQVGAVVDPLGSFLVNGRLPYIDTVVQGFPDALATRNVLSRIDADLFDQPFPVELIWCYWDEEGGLVQALNHILARFQNRRVGGGGPDPLHRFDLSPLRPLRSILYDWADDEMGRLTVRRRAAEYEYEYGLSLIGRAVPGNRLFAETRVRFLEAFHGLLHESHQFFERDDDTTVHADAFGILNALRDAHLVLAEGAHNQYGDLPTDAREQFLIMQWLLAQPEMHDFLGGRPMVPYAEPWMDRVDTMKTLFGWTPTSITHFHELAVLGEQLLLSVRFNNWNDLALDADNAANWAREWRSEIKRYVHAYRAATGVDLSTTVDARMPSALLAGRERSQSRRA